MLERFIDPAGLTPHGFCLAWEPGLIWLQATSDVLIALAYYSIPIALASYVRRRRDQSFAWIFWMFGAFIAACGTTHAFGALTLWVPAYWPDGFTKAITAVLSVTTAAMLWPLISRALVLPSPAELQRANAALRLQAKAREAANRQLEESEARYRTLFTRAPAAMHSLDSEKRIIEVSDRWLEMLGYTRDEVIGHPVTEFQEAESAAQMRSQWDVAVRQGVPVEAARRYVRKDGDVLDILLSATIEDSGPAGSWRSICILTDITARKRAEAALREAEQRLRHAEKLSALGQLAGGIAHDFNNMLQAVQGGAALVERHATDPERVRRLSQTVLTAAERGLAITHRLLVFSRYSDLRAEPIDPGTLLTGLADILGHTLGGGIEVRVEVTPDLPALHADKAQLETVLVNLATNARDAMSGTGTLTLSAKAETLAEDNGLHHPASLKAGSYIRLTVSDTGSGMDAETLKRAGEPFFTTKPVGKGTGLGLPMAQGFAEQSGGAFLIESAPGAGTWVSIWLPASKTSVPEPTAPGSRTAEINVGGKRPHVLVVDDEDLICEIVAAQLEEAGYAVLPAHSGTEALALLESGECVDLILSDLSMPGMNGITLIREAQRRRPGLPALLLTGFANQAAELALSGTGRGGGFSVLLKPISAEHLADRVAVLLEGARRQDRPGRSGER